MFFTKGIWCSFHSSNFVSNAPRFLIYLTLKLGIGCPQSHSWTCLWEPLTSLTNEVLSTATSAKRFTLTVKNYPLVEGRVSILKSPPHGEEKVVITILFLLESCKETMKNLTDGSSKSSTHNDIRLIPQKFSIFYYHMTFFTSLWGAIFDCPLRYIILICIQNTNSTLFFKDYMEKESGEMTSKA